MFRTGIFRSSALRPQTGHSGLCRYLSTPPKAPATPPPSFTQPSPIPLGDPVAQREYEELLKKAQQADLQSPDSLHPDALEKVEESWTGDKNPTTGEIGGPKGKEPTRYGDWERKGRVYDF
ncbi:hypothetical protein HDU85_002976 [Gaertneriomyces sp. JEL0708]|nr:hypothetical protein HDU85_002976 [Gaertneriomyces sp. JEL0708]